MIHSIERRFVRGAECRAAGTTEKPAIEGYAAVFNEEYVLYEDTGMRWVETIKPGAFAQPISEKQDVRCLFNHNPDHVLARSTNKTLLMDQDKKGLSYSADLDARTRIAADVHCFIDRKDVTGCSFSFRVGKQAWREEEQQDGKLTVYTREIEAISELYDVGPVTYPAYTGTSVGARSSLLHQLRSIKGIAPELRSRMMARALRDDDEEMSQGCECECRSCQDGNCAGCDTANCACQRSAIVSLEWAKARSRTLLAGID